MALTNTLNLREKNNHDLIYGVAKDLLCAKYLFLLQILVPILLDTNDLRSYTTLAKDLIPEEYHFNHHVAKKIIQIAAHAAADNYNSQLPEGATPINLEERTSLVRSNSNLLRDSAKTMLDAMGRRMFSDQEICRIVCLMNNPEYLWTKGSNAGKPDWCKIADQVNTEFGTFRTGQSLSSQIKVMRYNQDPRLEEALQSLQVEA